MSSVAAFDDKDVDSPLKSLVENRNPRYTRGNILHDFGCYELKLLVISQLSYIPVTSTMLSTAFYEPGQASCFTLNVTRNRSAVWFRKEVGADFVSILFDWDEVCKNSPLTAVMSTSLMVGALSGSFFAGWMADAYGRLPLLKACLLLICFANGVFSLVATITWPLSAAVLFILGCGCGGYMVFVAVLSWVSQHWLTYHLFVASTAFIAFIAFHLWIEESCRWLAGMHRYVEARFTAIKIMKEKTSDYQWWEILGFAKPCVSMSDTKRSLKKYTYADLFRFYFNADALPGNRYLNMVLMGISKFVMGCVLNITFCKVVPLFFKILGLLPFAVSSMVGRRPIVLIPLIAACTAALDPAWKINHLYSAELFPTFLRNMARAVCNSGARLGSIAAPMVVHLRSVHYLIPYLTFTLFLSAQVITVAFFMPETKNRPLPEMLPQPETLRQEEQLIEMNSKVINA
ncbi:hypothetical protein DICVIV_11313 [Dictyocaulus viviparus]|uniref:Transporter, major facilitator family protein n=1 Tax=Dictyocaulus viviparus TaxID=29172 RepID=A0A0D8XK81_DICVI|nr:hypothetical protein DICVIV_11313 [Dictyocaulus viviparus]